MDNDDVKTCCICKKKFIGWGNNPWPIADSELTCCDICNYLVVLPARIDRMYDSTKEGMKYGNKGQ